MKDEILHKIKSSIQENKSHLQKIKRTKDLLKDLFPANVNSFQAFSPQEIGHIDQFIYRFTKMQDSLGMRLIPALYSWLEGDTTPKPFLDIMNRLEKLEIIDSVDDWQFFRNLRNNLAHDYPESLVQTIETLNLLYEEIEKFLLIFQQLKQAWEKR
ncbi:hypothetical protein QUF70_20545 [Desulfobacterales bacterium HSG17]|nr:hypothetical protein [Desulfobacterales bacterium HSG17]